MKNLILFLFLASFTLSHYQSHAQQLALHTSSAETIHLNYLLPDSTAPNHPPPALLYGGAGGILLGAAFFTVGARSVSHMQGMVPIFYSFGMAFTVAGTTCILGFGVEHGVNELKKHLRKKRDPAYSN